MKTDYKRVPPDLSFSSERRLILIALAIAPLRSTLWLFWYSLRSSCSSTSMRHLRACRRSTVGRAILLRKGEILGDTTTSELEDQGKTLMQYIKETYHYRPDRVSRALDELTSSGE